MDGRTEILLSARQFLARLVDLLAPPRKHRRCHLDARGEIVVKSKSDREKDSPVPSCSTWQVRA